MKRKLMLCMLLIGALSFVGCGEKKVEQPSATPKQEEQKTTFKEISKIDAHEILIQEGMVFANGREVYIKGYMPKDEEKHTAIIMCHGYNGSNADFSKECRYYAENGIVAYAIDFCGGSARSKSSGKTTDMTIFTEKEDLLAVFDYVKTAANVDAQNVYLFGGSQGGLVAALAAEEVKDEAKGVALYFPAMNIPDDWRGRYKTEEQIPEEVDFWGVKLGKEFFTSIRDFNTFENIGKFSKKVLIIQGDKDNIVRLSVAEKAAECYSNAELVVLPGEGHGFKPEAGQTAMEKVLEFMKSE